MQELKKKAILITGGGGGLGRAIALCAAREGALLTIVDRDVELGQACVRALEDAGSQALFIAADISQSGDLQAVVAKVVERFGAIDGLVNAAGVEGVVETTVNYPEEAFDRVMAINARGVFLSLKYVLPVMLSQGSGSIVNLSSIAGSVGIAGYAAYTASKHAVCGLTRVAALEAGPSGVRVNAICPGAVDTRMLSSVIQYTAGHPDPLISGVRPGNPLGRICQPTEVAELAVFLLSPRSSYMNGAMVAIDGGYTTA